MKTQEFYEQLTADVLTAIEEGTAPWMQPWENRGGLNGGLPINAFTKQAYKGGNVLALMLRGLGRDTRWATFKQTQAAGLRIKTGAKGVAIVKMVPLPRKGEPTLVVTKEEGEVPTGKVAMIPKVYYVFNGNDIENLPEVELLPVEPVEWTDDLVPKLMKALEIPVTYGGDIAGYLPGSDQIKLPVLGAFKDRVHYVGVALHEAAHATGHATRLNRKLDYATEELVAELASLFLSLELGVTPGPEHYQNHLAYCRSWLGHLRKDKTAFFKAASMAQKATTWILDKVVPVVLPQAETQVA